MDSVSSESGRSEGKGRSLRQKWLRSASEGDAADDPGPSGVSRAAAGGFGFALRTPTPLRHTSAARAQTTMHKKYTYNEKNGQKTARRSKGSLWAAQPIRSAPKSCAVTPIMLNGVMLRHAHCCERGGDDGAPTRVGPSRPRVAGDHGVSRSQVRGDTGRRGERSRGS